MTLKKIKGSRKQQDTFDDKKNMRQLITLQMFLKKILGRKYESFPQFRVSVFDGINTEKFRKWLKKKSSKICIIIVCKIEVL